MRIRAIDAVFVGLDVFFCVVNVGTEQRSSWGRRGLWLRLWAHSADIGRDDASNAAGNCYGVLEIGKRSMMELLERRKEPRYLCFGQVKLSRMPGIVRSGRIIDLSLSGCLIEVRLPVYVSEGCAVELALQTEGIALRVLGDVAFVGKPRPGLVGISFVRLSERGQVQLRELIAELGVTPARNRNRLSSLKRRRGW